MCLWLFLIWLVRKLCVQVMFGVRCICFCCSCCSRVLVIIRLFCRFSWFCRCDKVFRQGWLFFLLYSVWKNLMLQCIFLVVMCVWWCVWLFFLRCVLCLLRCFLFCCSICCVQWKSVCERVFCFVLLRLLCQFVVSSQWLNCRISVVQCGEVMVCIVCVCFLLVFISVVWCICFRLMVLMVCGGSVVSVCVVSIFQLCVWLMVCEIQLNLVVRDVGSVMMGLNSVKVECRWCRFMCIWCRCLMLLLFWLVMLLVWICFM